MPPGKSASGVCALLAGRLIARTTPTPSRPIGGGAELATCSIEQQQQQRAHPSTTISVCVHRAVSISSGSVPEQESELGRSPRGALFLPNEPAAASELIDDRLCLHLCRLLADQWLAPLRSLAASWHMCLIDLQPSEQGTPCKILFFCALA